MFSSLAETISLIGSILAVVSMGIYLTTFFRGSVTPNPATWIIWFVIGLINAFTYLSVVHGNLSQALVLFIMVGGIVTVTVYSLFKGRFARISRLDCVILFLAGVVGVYWRTTGDAIAANLALQAVYVLSFIPTVMGLYRRELTETALPWMLAFFTYVAMIAAILVDWSAHHWVALAHPILNGLLGNGAVAYLAARNSHPVSSLRAVAKQPLAVDVSGIRRY